MVVRRAHSSIPLTCFIARCRSRLLWKTPGNMLIRQDHQNLRHRRRLPTSPRHPPRVFPIPTPLLTYSHDGPVWQVSWAHPKYGAILASASYDAHVLIWRDASTVPTTSSWSKLFDHAAHTSSVNSIAWSPHELGAFLACASSDGKVSVLEFRDDGSWDTKAFTAHGMGVNAVSWAPALTPGSLVATQGAAAGNVRKLATGGCDNLVRIWTFE
jgi:WD40 repeat protein